MIAIVSNFKQFACIYLSLSLLWYHLDTHYSLIMKAFGILNYALCFDIKFIINNGDYCSEKIIAFFIIHHSYELFKKYFRSVLWWASVGYGRVWNRKLCSTIKFQGLSFLIWCIVWPSLQNTIWLRPRRKRFLRLWCTKYDHYWDMSNFIKKCDK